MINQKSLALTSCFKTGMLDSYTSQILNFADSHTNSQLWCTIPFQICQISQSSTYEKLQKYHNFDPFLIARDFADLGNF